MKALLFWLMITATFASDCQMLEVVGQVRTEKNHYFLSLAEGTQSARRIIITQDLQSRFAPYLNQPIKSRLIIKKEKLVKVDSIERTIIDTLNHSEEKTFKNKGSVKCP